MMRDSGMTEEPLIPAGQSSLAATSCVRPATVADVPAIFESIVALARYERLEAAVTGSAAALEAHLFGDRPCVEALVAEWEGELAGFALFFTNYSTFLTQPGIYLEDLFVRPEYRRRGIGTALLRYLAGLAQAREAGRLEWSVLNWNQSAIAFYERLGAVILPEWRICRATGAAIAALADAD